MSQLHDFAEKRLEDFVLLLFAKDASIQKPFSLQCNYGNLNDFLNVVVHSSNSS